MGNPVPRLSVNGHIFMYIYKLTHLCHRLSWKSRYNVPQVNSGKKSDIQDKLAIFPPFFGYTVLIDPMSLISGSYQLYLGQLSLPGGKR